MRSRGRHGYDFVSPEPAYCGDCKEECEVVPLDLAFDYAGTHCTGGRGGTHYPTGHGEPVSDCCEAICYYDEDCLLEIKLDDCMDFPY